MEAFYKWFLKLMKPVVIWIGSKHLPFTRKQITGDHYYLWRDEIFSSYVLLTMTHGEFSNVINPSEIEHGGMYVGGDKIKYVVEALGKGVTRNNLVKFMTTKDIFIIVKPKFGKPEQIQRVVEMMKSFEGTPYDYLFESGDKALYCFEAIILAYLSEFPEKQFKYKEIVKGKRIWDSSTFLDDPENWEVIIDSRKDRI
jgi:hypothetical protein